MYNVIIVDDEEEIRNGIVKKVNWEEYGFNILATAENGKDALEKIEKLKPDVIFTDIKMPFLDGLKLIQIIHKEMYNIQVVVISGFDEFEYIKQAMDNNAIKYMLKPINKTELIDILVKIKTNLDDEYNQKRNLQTLEKYYLQSIPLIKTQFFIRTIEGKIDINQWKNKCNSLNMILNNEYFIVATIKYSFTNGKNIFEDNDELIPFSIKNIFDEKLQNFDKYLQFESFLYGDRVISIFSLENKSDIKKLIKELNNICDVYYKIMGIKITIGLGYIVKNVKDLKKSYESSEDAILYRLLIGSGKTIFINDIEPDKNIKLIFSENDEKILFSAIKIGDEEEIREFIYQIFENLSKGLIDLKECRLYFTEMMISILKLTKIYDINLENIFCENFEIYKEIDKFEFIDDAKRWFFEKSLLLAQIIKNQRINSTEMIVQKAKIFINENYNNPELSINNICDVLFISPTYFSAIFKKQLNISFIKYLTDLRLEKALELLNTTSEKTYIIAQKVGYTDANYFSYAFKKKFGVSPLKYKNNKD